MKYSSVSNPRWADALATAINMDVDFDGHGVLPFTASVHDIEAHGAELYARAVAGEFGEIAPYIQPEAPPAVELTREQQARQIIAAVLPAAKRASLNLYASRLALTTAKDRTEEQKSDIAVIISLDDWEASVLAAVDDPAAPWPEPPAGAIELIDAC